MKALFLTILMFPFTALAAVGPEHLVVPTGSPAVALNAAALDTAKSFQLNRIEGFSTLTLYIEFTHANNGTITVDCTASHDLNVTDYELTTCTIATGTCTLNDAGTFVSPSLSADKNWIVQVGVHGVRDLECTVTHGGTPTTGDIVTVRWHLITD